MSPLPTDVTGLPLAITPGDPGHIEHSEIMHAAWQDVDAAWDAIIAPIAPPVTLQVRYAAPWGADANDGLSWGSAKLTAGAAYDAVAAYGKVIYATGTLWDATAGNGLWLQWTGALAPGFRQAKQITIEGVGEANAGENSRRSKSLLNTNGASPAVHLQDVRNFTLRNYQNSTHPTGDLLMEETGAGSFQVVFENDMFRSSNAGQAVDIVGGDNTFWLWLIDTSVRGDANPGTANNVAFRISECFEWYWLGGTLMFGRALIESTTGVSAPQGVIRDVSVQGDLTVTNTLHPWTFTGGGGGGGLIVSGSVFDWGSNNGFDNQTVNTLVACSGMALKGRGTIFNTPQLVTDPNPNLHRQAGARAGQVFGQIDRFDYAGLPAPIKKQNLAYRTPAEWGGSSHGSYPAGGNATVAAVAGLFGTETRAGSMTFAGAGVGIAESVRASLAVNVGDIIAFTAFVKHTPAATGTAVMGVAATTAAVAFSTDLTGGTAGVANATTTLRLRVGSFEVVRLLFRVTATPGGAVAFVGYHYMTTGTTLVVDTPTFSVFTGADAIDDAMAMLPHTTIAESVGHTATFPFSGFHVPDGPVVAFAGDPAGGSGAPAVANGCFESVFVGVSGNEYRLACTGSAPWAFGARTESATHDRAGFYVGTGGPSNTRAVLEVKQSPASGETSIAGLRVDKGAGDVLVPVLLGAVDSGGVGFRALVVAN